MLVTKKLLKRCSYLVLTLLLLQFFLYYTNKYTVDYFMQEAIKIKKINFEDEFFIGESDEKINWENTSFIEYEKKRVGPGEI